MKKIFSSLMLATAISASAVFANMFYRNEMYDMMGFWGLGFFMGFGLAALAIGIFLFLFWLLMLIDCLKRDFKKDVEKIAWILVLIFLHLLGAIIYYFVLKVPGKQAAKEKKKDAAK